MIYPGDLEKLRAFVDSSQDPGVSRATISGLFMRNRTRDELDELLDAFIAGGGYETETISTGGRPAVLYRKKQDMPEPTPRYRVISAGISRTVGGNYTSHRKGEIVDLTETEAARLLKLEAVIEVPADTPQPTPEAFDTALPKWLDLDDLPRHQPSVEPYETLQKADICGEYDKFVGVVGRAPQVDVALRETLEEAQRFGEGINAATWNLNAHRAKAGASITAARAIAAEIVHRVRTGEFQPSANPLGSMYNNRPHNVLIDAAYRRFMEGNDAA